MLDKVLYVPAMIKNLISISRLLESAKYHVTFDRQGCCLLDSINNSLLAKAELKEGLYGLDLRPPRTIPNVHVTFRAAVGVVNNSMLWHARLGHVNERKLMTLGSASNFYWHTVPKLSQLGFCDSCAKGKGKL